MSRKAIHESVELELQPTITKFTVIPSQQYINENHLVATGNYEQRSYTGNKTQIDTKYNELYNNYSSSTDYKCSLTRTRMNGEVWKLDVRIDELETQQDNPENISAELEQSLFRKYGTKANPKLKSVNVSTQEQDILLHPMYDALGEEGEELSINLGVIRLYQEGALESDMIPNPNDPSQAYECGQFMAWDDPLVQTALKYKSYLVPNITITYTYFSRQRPTVDLNIPQFVIGSLPGGLNIPTGWQAMFCGRGSELTDEKKGYVVTETYTIGKYPLELYTENETA